MRACARRSPHTLASHRCFTLFGAVNEEAERATPVCPGGSNPTQSEVNVKKEEKKTKKHAGTQQGLHRGVSRFRWRAVKSWTVWGPGGADIRPARVSMHRRARNAGSEMFAMAQTFPGCCASVHHCAPACSVYFLPTCARPAVKRSRPTSVATPPARLLCVFVLILYV